MNRTHRIRSGIFAVMAAVLLLLGVGLPAHAEGTTTIHVNSSSIEVGKTLNVTVTATESAALSITYNAQVLEFTGADTEYTVNGNTVQCEGTSVSLTFQGKSQGKSSILVSSSTVTGSSTTINVSDASQSQETQPPSTAGNKEGQFVIDGVDYVVSERYPADRIPAGFERVTVTIDGYGYRELSNGSITLLYLKKASDLNADGTFYVYDEDSHSVSPFWMLGTPDQYVLVMKPDQVLSDRLSPVEGYGYPAYATGAGNGFHFVYGSNQDGVEGWYQYDETYGTIQRVNDEFLPASQDTVEDPSEAAPFYDAANLEGKVKILRYIIAALVFLLVISVVVGVNLFLAGRRAAEDWDEEEDEEEETPEVSPQVQSTPEDDEESEEEPEAEDDAFYQKDTHRIRNMFRSKEPEEAEEAEEAEEDMTSEAEQVLEEKPERIPSEESFLYESMHGTEAFRSKKDTRYKADSNTHIDIMDLNDL